METHIIYKITSPSGKSYIGRTNDFDRRMREHKSSAKNKPQFTLHKAINKYGWDNLVIEKVGETTDVDTAIIMEETLIQKHDSVGNGYNDTYGGGGHSLWKDNPELLSKMKDSLKEAYKNGYVNPMTGKKHSDETIQKQKQKAKGRFSLPWYIDRNGKEEGTRLYEERRQFLKNRNLKKDKYGRFISKTS